MKKHRAYEGEKKLSQNGSIVSRFAADVLLFAFVTLVEFHRGKTDATENIPVTSPL